MAVYFSSFSVQVGDATQTYTDVNEVIARANVITSEVRVVLKDFGMPVDGEDAKTCAKYISLKNLSSETSVSITLLNDDGTTSSSSLKASDELVMTSGLEGLMSIQAQGDVADATVEYTIASGFKLNYEAK